MIDFRITVKIHPLIEKPSDMPDDNLRRAQYGQLMARLNTMEYEWEKTIRQALVAEQLEFAQIMRTDVPYILRLYENRKCDGCSGDGKTMHNGIASNCEWCNGHGHYFREKVKP